MLFVPLLHKAKYFDTKSSIAAYFSVASGGLSACKGSFKDREHENYWKRE